MKKIILIITLLVCQSFCVTINVKWYDIISDSVRIWESVNSAEYQLIDTAQSDDSGSYQVELTDPGTYQYKVCDFDSVNICLETDVITVAETGPTPPTITSQPQNTTVNENSTASFSITATGAASYTTYRNGTSVGSTDSYSFTATLANNGDRIWWKVSNNDGDTWSDTAVLTVNDTIIPPDPPVVTVNPVNDTTTGNYRYVASWTGQFVQVAWYRFHGTDTVLMSRDSVLTGYGNAGIHNDSFAVVLWNSSDTVMSTKGKLYFVYAAFDSVNTTDSNRIYVHGNFLAGTGWTATLGDSTLTTESGSATAQIFGYNHKITLSTNRYQLVITDGAYTVTLYIGRRKSTGNNKKMNTGFNLAF